MQQHDGGGKCRPSFPVENADAIDRDAMIGRCGVAGSEMCGLCGACEKSHSMMYFAFSITTIFLGESVRAGFGGVTYLFERQRKLMYLGWRSVFHPRPVYIEFFSQSSDCMSS